MRPLGKKILVIQDEKEVEPVTKSAGGILISLGGMDSITEEINKNKDAFMNEEELDRFGSELRAKTSVKAEKIVEKLNTGIVWKVGKDVDQNDIAPGDRVKFNPYGHTPEEWEGEAYLLMESSAVTLNLSKD